MTIIKNTPTNIDSDTENRILELITEKFDEGEICTDFPPSAYTAYGILLFGQRYVDNFEELAEQVQEAVEREEFDSLYIGWFESEEQLAETLAEMKIDRANVNTAFGGFAFRAY